MREFTKFIYQEYDDVSSELTYDAQSYQSLIPIAQDALLYKCIGLSREHITRQLQEDYQIKDLTQQDILNLLIAAYRYMGTNDAKSLRAVISEVKPDRLQREIDQRGMLYIHNTVIDSTSSTVLLLSAIGFLNEEISRELGIKSSSVNQSLIRVQRRIGVSSKRKLLKIIAKEVPHRIDIKAQEYGHMSMEGRFVSHKDNQILHLIAVGLPIVEIAGCVNMDERSLRVRLSSSLYPFLGVSGRKEAASVVYAQIPSMIDQIAASFQTIRIGNVVFAGSDKNILQAILNANSVYNLAETLQIPYGNLRVRLSATLYPKLGVHSFSEAQQLLRQVNLSFTK